ncbi:MAG: alpha/beta hydrolase [Anaerolineaceae bacterium]|nr:alpha/beta hydrolase [Anaerolineaceae bacterium]
MSEWFDGYVTANGIKLHYTRTGGDKPVVVMNHGLGDDGLCWTHVAKQLEQEYDLILPDARGHGKSASGKGDYSLQQRVADLKGIIEALKLDKPIIGGHSMGADTSLHLAAEFPELTRGVFLEDPPIILPGEKLGSADQQLDSAEDLGKMMVKFFRLFKLLPKFISRPMAKKAMPSYPEDEITPWLNSKKRISFDLINGVTGMEINLSDPFEAISRIQAPVLLFIGDKEKMSITSPEAAQKAAEANDNLRVVHLEGASHDIRRTRFDGYLPELQSFFREVYAK